MSLIKQLWLGIVAMMLIALGGSFVVSGISAKHYLEDELRIKNIDNANSLALSISQMQKDPVTLELLVSAQFDTGHYEYIALTDPNNKILVEKKFESRSTTLQKSPQWFSQLIGLDSKPGVALIQDGWQQYGTITLKTHSRYAIDALWKSCTELAFWFVLVCTLGGAIGTWILKTISRPLDVVIQQAEAIGQRQFIVSEEPKTFEFQRLVRAMNRLSTSVKMMLDKETKQLEQLRKQTQFDALTELANREHILNLFASSLKREDGLDKGSAILVRLSDLADINRQSGRAHADFLLRHISAVFHQLQKKYSPSFAGRLNASDFLFITEEYDAKQLTLEIQSLLTTQCEQGEVDELQLPIASTHFEHGEIVVSVLARLDKALAEAELKADGQSVHIHLHKNDGLMAADEWRQHIHHAINSNLLSLATYPVYGKQKELIHYETALRLTMNNDLKHASYFLPWASRLGLLPQLDLAALKLALSIIPDKKSLSLNVSEDSLKSPIFREKSLEILRDNIAIADSLWFEFPESSAIKAPTELKSYVDQLKHLGCHCGLEHVGFHFTKINEMQNLGLQFLKIDGTYIHGIHKSQGDQQFIQGICRIGNSLGIAVIAEQVSTQEEFDCLQKLSLDGYTGPFLD